MTYRFDLIRAHDGEPQDPAVLRARPFVATSQTFEHDAALFVPGEDLATAMNVALALGDPLLLTGEPGTGKTQAAYFLAHRLGVPIVHFQVKSESTARDLLYQFDSVRYFHDANERGATSGESERTADAGEPGRGGGRRKLDKREYVEFRGLGKAMVEAQKDQVPRVVLLDEIDKAPRDFPNDLLLELDQMRFTVSETGEEIRIDPGLRPIVVITSNSERRLPEPFLRRCVYHHIAFDDQLVRSVVERRRNLYGQLSDELIQLAMERFMNLRGRDLRGRDLRKIPATSELLSWLQVLAHALGAKPDELQQRLSDRGQLKRLPYLSVLLKDHQDVAELE